MLVLVIEGVINGMKTYLAKNMQLQIQIQLDPILDFQSFIKNIQNVVSVVFDPIIGGRPYAP